jgi:hypothetical protein
MGVWDKQGSSTAASGVTSVAGRTGTVTLTAADISAGTFPGAIAMASTLSVSGASTLAAVTGTTGSFSSTLGVTGASTLSSTLAVSGATTLSSTLQATSLGIGTGASATTGQILATNSITAYYSDERLKTKINTIENALDKIDQLTGFLYTENTLANDLGFNNPDVQVALGAQSVQSVQPEAVSLAPFDRDNNGNSKSGENYLTVNYERLVPLLVEGIKELRREINQLKGK